jgi:tRNA(Ile)-lysidine synthetase-like protein
LENTLVRHEKIPNRRKPAMKDRQLNDFDRGFGDLSAAGEGLDFGFLEGFRGVIVCCSGGLDSMALSDVLFRIAKRKKNFSLALCHVNFGLRGKESDKDQAFVETWARRRKIPCMTRQARDLEKSKDRKESVQAWARRIRWVWFEELARDGWLLALAHHQDDLAENVVLRLVRGTSAGRMGGMRVLEGAVWRPLLGVSRKEIERYARSKRMSWREDRSNRSDVYARNRVRKRVLPVLEEMHAGVSGRIARCASEASDVWDWCLERISKELIEGDGTSIKVERLASLSRGVAMETLGIMVLKASGSQHSRAAAQESGSVARESLEALWRQARSGGGASEGWRKDLGCGLVGEIRRGMVRVIGQEPAAKAKRSAQYRRLWTPEAAPAVLGGGAELRLPARRG